MARRTGFGGPAAFGIALGFYFLSAITVRSQQDLKVGYAVINASGDSPLPVATALFSYRNAQGILVSEAGVAAVEPTSAGRIFVEAGAIRTGLALANPSNSPVTVQLTLRDDEGREQDQRPFLLAAGEHRARYVDEGDLFGSQPEGFTGTLTFETQDPEQEIAAVTIRQALNAYGEPLLATLPVVERAGSGSGELIFPHLGAGDILTTQIILINPGSRLIRGEIALKAPSGQPLELELDGVYGSSFPFELEPEGLFRATLTSSSGVFQGYATVQVESGDQMPAGTALFQYRNAQGELISEAGVQAVAATRKARIFVDTVGTQTGVAVANAGNPEQSVIFRLFDRNGLSLGETSRTLLPNGQLAIFVDQLFEDLPTGFTGVMEIEGEEAVCPITLKLTFNQRNDPILTTLPVADLERLPQGRRLVVPQIGTGRGFSTRLIVVGTGQLIGPAGRILFVNSDATPMRLPVLGEWASEFPYSVEPGGAVQVRAGNTEAVADILFDSATLFSAEVVVNQGNTLVVRPLVIDTDGELRDDFPVTFHTIDPAVASVDGFGEITGHKAGFSTLTVTAGGVVVTTTVTVVTLTSGLEALEVTGIAQDSARRLYLANTGRHTILLAQDLESEPGVYAGVQQTPGLKNDQRLKSLFDKPAYLAFDHSRGILYVSDSSNHVIRLVEPGTGGGVETLTGTGESGARDGILKEATFHNPRGIALDHRGGLWVVDSGNHTVRRIDLAAGTVETVAGVAGSAGWADGSGPEARFNSPVGLAVETESLSRQLERETRGEPPGPLSMIVTDTGNGMLRRVSETGEVQTIGSAVDTGLTQRGIPISKRQAQHPLTFSQPTGVAVDPFGSIYITERGSGEVTGILENGDVIRVAEEGTFARPNGVVITERGKVLVGDGNHGALQVSYGEPVINAVTPSRISNQGGDVLTVTGGNFAPDTLVVLGPALVADVQVQDTKSLSFVAPSLPSGLCTLTVQNRAGVAQTSLLVEAVPLGRLTPGEITSVAGGASFAGDGSEATSSSVLFPMAVAVDSAGNVFLADSGAERIRKVDAVTKIITTIVGTGNRSFSGDGGPAIGAALAEPSALAVAPNGDLFICDSSNGRIRRVDPATGLIATVAGGGEPVDGLGDGGPATLALFFDPAGIAINTSGDLFVADRADHRIRKIAAATGTVTTVAGTGQAGFSGDGAAATEAALNEPCGTALDSAGNLFVADRRNLRVRKVDRATGIITTVAGGGSIFRDDALATATTLEPSGVAIDLDGNLLVADQANERVRRVDLQSGIITTVAGSGSTGFSGDGGPAKAAELRFVHGLTVDAGGSLLIADSGNGRVRKVNAHTATITTLAGNGQGRFSGENRPALEARLAAPEAVAWLTDGSFLIADTDNGRIRKVDALTGIINTFAGTGEETFSGEGGPATAAAFVSPTDVAFDDFGNIFLTAAGNSLVLRVDSAGVLDVVAGNRDEGYSGDGGPATSAALNFPMGIALDSEGDLFIADTFNSRIRRVDSSTGLITTVAGNGREGFSGDGGQATAASLNEPSRVAVGAGGKIFISDTRNHRIRQVNLSTGIITTIAGDGRASFTGDGGLAVLASLDSPRGVCVDAGGNLLIADVGNGRIRRLDFATGIITTVAGAEEHDFSGDNGPALGASLNFPRGVSIDLTSGDLLIADTYNDRIRAVRGPIE